MTISAQRKVTAVNLLPHHRWECTFPDLCLSVGTQSTCADGKLGWEDSSQAAWQAGRQYIEQKPVRENSAGDLVFSAALLLLCIAPPGL